MQFSDTTQKEREREREHLWCWLDIKLLLSFSSKKKKNVGKARTHTLAFGFVYTQSYFLTVFRHAKVEGKAKETFRFPYMVLYVYKKKLLLDSFAL